MARDMRGRLCAAVRAAVMLAILALLATVPASAEQTALSIEFSVQPGVMVAPGDVTMTFVLRNESDAPVQNIYLTSADGQFSEPIGQLGAGESQTLARSHTVTQQELDSGEISYIVSHDAALPGEEKISHVVRAAIIKSDVRPNVSFTRQLSSGCVPRGGLVTVTYKITNTGNVALNALRIRDDLGDFTGRLEQLGVGDAKTFISRVTLIEAAESRPVLEYAASSGEHFTSELEPARITIADSALEISFSVGQSVFNRDTADAILILMNSGNVDYTGITVLDDVYGGVIADSVSVASGAGPVEIAHTYPLRGEGEYRWRITGVSEAGETLDLRTDTLALPGASEGQAVAIELEAAARTPRINRPGRVIFDFTIANAGTVMARDALLYEVNRGEIRRLAVLPTGAPMAFSAGYDVSEASQFIFCLNYTDAQGRQRTVTSAPIDVEISPEGVNPEPIDGTDSDLTGASVKPGGNSAAFVALLVVAGASLTVMLTILAVTSLRARRERLKRVAAEKQRIKAELGKTGPYTPVKSPARKRKGERRGGGANKQKG